MKFLQILDRLSNKTDQKSIRAQNFFILSDREIESIIDKYVDKNFSEDELSPKQVASLTKRICNSGLYSTEEEVLDAFDDLKSGGKR